MTGPISRLTREELWALVDQRLTDPGVVAVMEQILGLVATEWQTPGLELAF